MDIDECIKNIELILNSNQLDQYSTASLKAIFQRLNSFKSDSRSLNQDLKGYIARLVVETNPAILSPEFGGQLINIEKAYYNA